MPGPRPGWGHGVLRAPIIMLAGVTGVFACLWGVMTEEVWQGTRPNPFTDRT
jgi:hypothetical protein